jgi:hypothetical protein
MGGNNAAAHSVDDANRILVMSPPSPAFIESGLEIFD